MRRKMASVMAALSVRTPTVLLLLIFVQMLISLVLFGGVFILSNETLISPFHVCSTHQHGELSFDAWYRRPVCGGELEIKINFFATAVILSLYIPVVLVAFALLAMLLAAYAKDRAALWFSMACQAASSLLILTGITGFLLLYRSYVSWDHMTIWFYTCVAVQVELSVLTVLTFVSRRRLTSGWD